MEYSNPDTEKTNSEIGFIPSQGLGDGLLQLVFAQNLAKQGYSVCVYQDHLSNIEQLINLVEIHAYSDAQSMQKALTKHKIVLFDQGSYFAKKIVPQFDKYPDHFIAYSASRTKASHQVSDHFGSYLSKHQADHLNNFTAFNDSLRHPFKRHLTITEHFLWKMNKELGCSESNLKLDFDIPSEWLFKRNANRVVLHPTSALKSKNWSASSFLQLAIRLCDLGWQPEFSVSPQEWDEWSCFTNGEYMAPACHSILDLAHYYYESAAFIGNDSGNGHLASAMGLPVLSIFNRKKLYYPWKPSWSRNLIVAPWLPKSIVKDKWSQYLSVDKVIKEFDRLIDS